MKPLSEFSTAARTEITSKIREFFPWRATDPSKWGLFADPDFIATSPWPVTFVGLNNGSVVATASIVSCDRKDLPHRSPWFAGFVVVKRLRNKGLGTQMLHFAEEYARQQNVQTLWLDTERNFERSDQPEWYKFRGWEFESDSSLQEGIVMFKNLRA